MIKEVKQNTENEQMDLKKAVDLINQKKKENEENFQRELQELLKKYNVSLTPQIIIHSN